MEDKLEVVSNMETLLKSTRAFHDLDRLEYVENDHGEYVLAFFKDRPYDGPDYYINVTADSGIAIVMDIMRRLY